MAETTTRLGLPLLVPGQGQKDMTHNEALGALDMLVQPVLQSRAILAPPSSPEQGDCWLIPDAASGAWSDRVGQLACWTAGGWRFMTASEGWAFWIIDEDVVVRKRQGEWQRSAPWSVPSTAIPAPVGGTVVDNNARLAIVKLLGHLSALGLIGASQAE